MTRVAVDPDFTKPSLPTLTLAQQTSTPGWWPCCDVLDAVGGRKRVVLRKVKKMGLGLCAVGRGSDGVRQSDGNVAGLSDVSDPGEGRVLQLQGGVCEHLYK